MPTGGAVTVELVAVFWLVTTYTTIDAKYLKGIDE